MRRKRENQLPLSGLWPGHRLAQELKAVSKILDDNPSILGLVLHDLCDTAGSGQGAPGLSAEQVLRAAILKNWHQLPDTKLAFLLSDSQPRLFMGHVDKGFQPGVFVRSEPGFS